MKLSHCLGTSFLLFFSFGAVSSFKVTEKTHELEKLYIDDCEHDPTPHGFYGAFLEPCEFSFFDSKGTEGCESENLLASPLAVHWLFQLQEHIDKDDWANLSSDDVPDFEELMLWPDQCVGVLPKCYQLGTSDSIVDQTLMKLFPEGIPAGATHVKVDCRADAMELSRVVYSFSTLLEKALPAIFAIVFAVIFLSVAAISCCLYGCCRLCNTPLTRRYETYEAVPLKCSEQHSYYEDVKYVA